MENFSAKGEVPKEQCLWEAASSGKLALVQELAEDPLVNVNWGDAEYGRTAFYRACFFGKADIVRYLMAHPRVDVNRKQKETATPLCAAASEGHREVIDVLLADPRVEVNEPWQESTTPFYMACAEGHEDVVATMLTHPRVDANRPKADNSSPLWIASQGGHLRVVQVLLASARTIDTKRASKWNGKQAADHAHWASTQAKWPDVPYDDPAKRKRDCPLIMDLILSYEINPASQRHHLRRQPGVREHYIGHTFALVVFYTDGFVRVKRLRWFSSINRFMKICSHLPLDLQMVLCNRMFGCARDIILTKDSEPGFRWLARPTSWV